MPSSHTSMKLANLINAKTYSGDRQPNLVDIMLFKAFVELLRVLDRSGSLDSEAFQELIANIGLDYESAIPETPLEVPQSEIDYGPGRFPEFLQYFITDYAGFFTGIMKALEAKLELADFESFCRCTDERFNGKLEVTDLDRIYKEIGNKVDIQDLQRELKNHPTQNALDDMRDHINRQDGLYLQDFIKEVTKNISIYKTELDKKQDAKDLYYLVRNYATKDDISQIQRILEANSIELIDLQNINSVLTGISSLVEQIRIYTNTISIPSAELLALNATPKLLLTAPQSIYYYDIISVKVSMDYDSSAYTVAAGNDFSIQYATSGVEVIQIENTGYLDQTADKIWGSSHGGTHEIIYGEGVQIKMLSSEVTNGDSDIEVEIKYRICC